MNIVKTQPVADEEEEDDGRGAQPETVNVFDPDEWDGYLKEVDVDNSIVMLHNALHLPVPMDVKDAKWLDQIKECDLFMAKVWQPLVESSTGMPMVRGDLKRFIEYAAARWVLFANQVAEGNVTFKEMEEILRLQPNADSLARTHLQSRPIEKVGDSYRDFRNLQELRHMIGPFVAALRFFNIRNMGPVENLYDFITTNLVNNWDETTLAQVYQTGIIDSLNSELNIDPDRLVF